MAGPMLENETEGRIRGAASSVYVRWARWTAAGPSGPRRKARSPNPFVRCPPGCAVALIRPNPRDPMMATVSGAKADPWARRRACAPSTLVAAGLGARFASIMPPAFQFFPRLRSERGKNCSRHPRHQGRRGSDPERPSTHSECRVFKLGCADQCFRVRISLFKHCVVPSSSDAKVLSSHLGIPRGKKLNTAGGFVVTVPGSLVAPVVWGIRRSH